MVIVIFSNALYYLYTLNNRNQSYGLGKLHPDCEKGKKLDTEERAPQEN